MTPRQSLRVPPGGDTARRTADKLSIADSWVLQNYTPASAADTTAPDIRFAYGYDYGQTSGGLYLHVQVASGDWRKAALS